MVGLELDPLFGAEQAVLEEEGGLVIIAGILEVPGLEFPPPHRPATVSPPQRHDSVAVSEPRLPQFVHSLEEGVMPLRAKPKLEQHLVVAVFGGIDGSLRSWTWPLSKSGGDRSRERGHLAAQNQAVELRKLAPQASQDGRAAVAQRARLKRFPNACRLPRPALIQSVFDVVTLRTNGFASLSVHGRRTQGQRIS
jgi:hypothetical protein